MKPSQLLIAAPEPVVSALRSAEPAADISLVEYADAEKVINADPRSFLVVVTFSADVLLAMLASPSADSVRKLSRDAKSVSVLLCKYPNTVCAIDGGGYVDDLDAALSSVHERFDLDTDWALPIKNMILPSLSERLRALITWEAILSPALFDVLESLSSSAHPANAVDDRESELGVTIKERLLHLCELQTQENLRLSNDLIKAEAEHQVNHLLLVQMQHELDLANSMLDSLENTVAAGRTPASRAKGKWWFRLFISSKTRQQMKILEQADEFDGDWYLTTYKDLTNLNMPAAYHYLKFGAKEHRDPSPYFSTQRYAWLHPDLDFSVTNPLVHYLSGE